MNVTMAIPTYWGRASSVGLMQGDAIYDHPTPLDAEGTLLRAIQSIEVLAEKDFRLVIVAVPTADDIGSQVEQRIKNIIGQAKVGVEILLFSPSHLKQIHDLFGADNKPDYAGLLQLRGYSNVRNLCTFISQVLGSDVAILIDDDEVFEDPSFASKAKEYIGKKIGGKNAYAVAGYYLQPDGDYHVRKKLYPWMKYWDQYERMNEAFDAIIGTEPRLKETPFVFGGNMVLHRELFTKIPFDPYVRRGEDIDFLMNARMFGFPFFLDNRLSIKHLAPPKSSPVWMQVREDIYRFVYQRAKIRSQKEVKGMKRIYPDEFDPYPGCFLKDDLDEKVERSCQLLSDEYRAQKDKKGSEEALKNIQIARDDAVPRFDPFDSLCKLQKQWSGLMEYAETREIGSRLTEIILGRKR